MQALFIKIKGMNYSYNTLGKSYPLQKMPSTRDDQILNMIFNNPGEFVLNDIKDSIPINDKLLKELKIMEIEAVQLAEQKLYLEALKVLDEAIMKCPTYGSLYNNKAQILTLMERVDESLIALELAIEYGDTLVLGKAYTQKGLILLKLNKELEAEEAFKNGARFGNSISKQKLQQNPYAKMCSNILKVAMNNQ